MVQLKILSGKQAGAVWSTRRFPVRIGRSPDSDLQLEEPGVWDEHFHINLNPSAGFTLESRPEALVTANGQPVQRTVLHNGDVIEIGSLKLQFWLAEARQRGLKIREALVWTIVIAVCLGQITLIYWLIS